MKGIPIISRLATGRWPSGPHREGDEPKPVKHEREKSDSAIVAGKPANGGGQPPPESVERRAEAEGNAAQGGMLRTPSREGMSHGLDRVRTAATSDCSSNTQGGSRMP